jgi:hypothetical protein
MTSEKRDLEQLEAYLWEQFKKAKGDVQQYGSYGTHNGNHLGAQTRLTVAQLAQSIVAVRAELRAEASAQPPAASPIKPVKSATLSDRI